MNTVSRPPGSKLPIEEMFETRRQFPRLRTDIEASLSAADGRRQAVRIVDLSPDGAQIRLLQRADHPVLSRSTPIDVLKNGHFRLEFELASGMVREQVRVGIRPVYLRTVDNGEIASGVTFEKDDAGALHAIRAFLASEMQPVTEVPANLPIGDGTAGLPGGPSAEMAPKPAMTPLNAGGHVTPEELRHEFNRIHLALAQIQLSLRHVEERLSVIEARTKRIDLSGH